MAGVSYDKMLEGGPSAEEAVAMVRYREAARCSQRVKEVQQYSTKRRPIALEGFLRGSVHQGLRRCDTRESERRELAAVVYVQATASQFLREARGRKRNLVRRVLPSSRLTTNVHAETAVAVEIAGRATAVGTV